VGQGMSNVDSGQRCEGKVPALAAWVVMIGQRFDNTIRQSPEPQEIGPDFGMRGIEYRLFCLPIGDVFRLYERQCLLVEFGVMHRQDQLADIMQQAGGEGMLCHLSRAALFLGQTSGIGPDGDTVIPDGVE
jgi:hypothetical protein